jgi:sec-independent protein translocase protein TatB
MFLDPAKLLVILIVALVVLGPDKLPTVARQMGAAWGEIRRFRERLETEVRGTFPDLPSTHQVAQAVRSPLSFLDQLADAHEREQQNAAGTPENESTDDRPLSIQPSTPATNTDNDTAGNDIAGLTGAAPEALGPDMGETGPQKRGSGQPGAGEPEQEAEDREREEKDAVGSVSALTGESSRSSARRVGRTRPWRGADPGETPFIPDDPSMN